jgi:OmcA/MtrC family decaheme c-type cytochrome
MKNRFLRYGGAALLALFIAGCGGDDGKDGAPGKDADPTITDGLQDQIDTINDQIASQTLVPEQCNLCHTGENPVARTGPMHQELYKEFYQDGVMTIAPGSMVLTTNGVDTTTLQFRMVKDGTPFDCTKPAANESATGDFTIGSYWAVYVPAVPATPTTPAVPAYFSDDLSLNPVTAAQEARAKELNPDSTTKQNGTRTYDPGTGVCTLTTTQTTTANKARVAAIDAVGTNGIVQIYGVDEILETNPEKHMSNGKYPFAGVLKNARGTVDYTSAANVSGCENCHTQPFLKHAYIYGTVTDNAGAGVTEFYTCKGCHYDLRNGGHVDWQILKDDPARYAEIQGGSAITDAEKTKYAYKARLMNDVHMSHNMEFAYPQRAANCVTCHEGKLATVLADDKFKAETCISCHSLDDPDNETSGAQRGFGLLTMMKAAVAYNHSALVGDLALLRSYDCTQCHKQTGGLAPGLGTFHNGGYDPRIYTDTGVRYSDTFTVAIDSATLDAATNKLTFTFKATESPDIAGLGVADITPQVLIGLYGYDTKDFIVAAHNRDDANQRLLEWTLGETANPRFTGSVVGPGSWTVTADLSMWADMLDDGSIKRAEIAVLPILKNADGVELGMNAPSRTFNLATNAFEDDFMKYGGQFTTDNLVKVAKTVGADGVTGCNTCHDQLATTFHSGKRGGNIRVCRICHEVSSAGSHLELQSRSIDSYVHAIHSFQAFDPEDIDFTNPEEAIEYQHHIGTEFPRFGVLNCESCHNTGRYNVPDQARSMPGVLSGTQDVQGRNIGEYDPAVTGPAVRACGGCHRAQKINADDAGGLATLVAHWRTFGYVIDVPDVSDTDNAANAANRQAVWEKVVDYIMGLFKS